MDFSQARKNMVDGQLTPNKIVNESLINRFLSVPREAFVDVSNKNTAYVDNPVTIHGSRKIFPPLVCAHMLQALNLNKSDNVLVAASSSGYTASILCGLVNNVYAVESDLNLIEMSKRALLDASCKSITVSEGAPENGLREKSEFDKIIINTVVEFIPENLVKQLTDGGQISTVFKNDAGIYSIKVFTKENEKLEEKSIREVVAMPVHSSFKKNTEFTL